MDESRQYETTRNECMAMRLLAKDGYSAGVLKMVMHLSKTQDVRKHVTGECRHEVSVSPVRDWDGDGDRDVPRKNRIGSK